ncbi:SMI1/KNR4 family protein [Paenibacillus sp. UMB4589-SE434]|uniref:SMI1/KNR4 family protein n=1 Tax=Paenibacillus sp. UMB4589-SE434 TaxID=3046314 RepID=UPI00254FDD1F|nr:SMI1/KNR4 family protein [Paenibacillus sp. UMB4589-SE434]MDK8180314.1 SMI1/KNR4 family protein [Paenibacillus sp. UMB4589-SE434]
MNWKSVFEVRYQELPGVTEQELEHVLDNWNKPLSKDEIIEISGRQRNPFPKSDPMHHLFQPFDPSKWSIPRKRLPATYLDLLRYSNGGEFANGERHFQFFSADELRVMLLAYEFPQYMPGAVSFAMDGCGHHYAWDMRSDQEQTEYPILVTHSGNLGYEDAVHIAGTFIELCKGTISVEDLLYE